MKSSQDLVSCGKQRNGSIAIWDGVSRQLFCSVSSSERRNSGVAGGETIGEEVVWQCSWSIGRVSKKDRWE